MLAYNNMLGFQTCEISHVMAKIEYGLVDWIQASNLYSQPLGAVAPQPRGNEAEQFRTTQSPSHLSRRRRFSTPI